MVEQREEENKGGYNDNKNRLCGDKARDSNSETSLSLTLFLYIYISLSKASSSLNAALNFAL